jgi:hypothetical protein
VTLDAVADRYSQKRHPYGFSPLWLRSCSVTVDALAARYSQKRQPYGFSPLWLRSWRVM